MTSFPDQPFGLVDSGKLGVFGTPVALFSSSAEFGPYAHWYNYNHIKNIFKQVQPFFTRHPKDISFRMHSIVNNSVNMWYIPVRTTL